MGRCGVVARLRFKYLQGTNGDVVCIIMCINVYTYVERREEKVGRGRESSRKINKYIYIYMHIYIYTYIYIYIYMYLCMSFPRKNAELKEKFGRKLFR